MKEWDDIEKRIAADSEKLKMEFQEEFWDDMEVMLDENENVIALSSVSEDIPFVSTNEELFKEEYWDEMSLILDKEDKKRRRVLFFRWSFDLAAISLLALMLFQPDTPLISNEGVQTLAQSNQTNADETLTTVNQVEKTEKAEILAPAETNTASNAKQPGNQLLREQLVRHSTPQAEQAGVVSPTTPVTAIAKSSVANNLSASTDNLLSEQSNFESSIRELKTVPAVVISTVNSPLVNQTTLGQLNTSKRGLHLRPLSINLTANMNAALAPTGNVENKARLGSSTSLGIEVQKHLVNWSYSLGTTISHRTGLNHELFIAKSTYGARLYREYQSVSYKSFNSIGIPVGVNYHHKRDVFGFKLIPTWNLMVNSTYHRYNNYNSDELLVRNNYGIKEGINPFDLKLQLSYQRRITERLSVGMNITKGFFNQIDQNIITNSDGLRDFSVGFSMNYTLFKL